MRIAVFSDVHANTLALDAVLADATQTGVDGWWFLGDVADMGYDPAGSVRRLADLPDLVAVRGNADRIDVASDLAAKSALLDDAADGSAAARELAYLRGASWSADAIQEVSLLDWLTDLPLERRMVLPDGTRVLLVHASPGRDDGAGIRPEHEDADVAEHLVGIAADLMIVGHTHLPFERTSGGVRIWNPGSVSNPVTADRRAMWTLLEADDRGYTLTRQIVDYDVDEMLTRLDASSLPTRAMVRAFWE